MIDGSDRHQRSAIRAWCIGSATAAASGKDEAVVLERQIVFTAVFLNDHGLGVDVDSRYVLSGTNIDVMSISELGDTQRGQTRKVVHPRHHSVGDGADVSTGVLAFLEYHDLAVGLVAAKLERRRVGCPTSTNDYDALDHDWRG